MSLPLLLEDAEEEEEANRRLLRWLTHDRGSGRGRTKEEQTRPGGTMPVVAAAAVSCCC